MSSRIFMTHFRYNVPSALRFSYSKNYYRMQPKLYQHEQFSRRVLINSDINKFYISHQRKFVTNATKSIQKNCEICNHCLQSIGYIKNEYFQNLIKSLESTLPSTISMEQSLFLLESCANYLPTSTNLDRINLFNKIWSYLRDNNILNQKHYMMALKVLELNHISVNDIGKYIKESDLIMDQETYERLISLSCSTGNINKATEILSEMKDRKISITENIFNSLILGHSRCKNLLGSESVLHLMNAANLKPSTETKYQFLKAYIENGSKKNFDKLLEECLNTNVIFTVHQIRDILESAANYEGEIINKIIKLFPNDLIQSDIIPLTLQNLCVKLIYEDKIDPAFNILMCFRGPTLNEDRDIDKFGSFFINELIHCKVEPSKVILICSKLSVKNPRALHVACEIMLRNNPDEAVMYFKALASIEPLRPHYFWPILLISIKEKCEIDIINTLKLMKSLNVDLDNETFSQYILPNMSVLLKDKSKAVDTFASAGLKVSQILVPTIEYLIKSKQINQISNLLNIYPTKLSLSHLILSTINLILELKSASEYKNFANLIVLLNKASNDTSFDFIGQCLIEVLVSSQNKPIKVSSIISILNELFANNIKISSVASDVIAQYIIKNYEKNGETKELLSKMIDKQLKLSSSEMNSSNIKLPRDMSLNELECHLVELESKNMNTRGVLRRLLQLCVRENKLERSLEVLQKCESQKVHLSGGMLASIFDLNIKLKDLESATKSYNRLQQLYPNFSVDEFKIVDYLTLMVENGELNQAKKFVLENLKHRKVVPGKHLYKNVWKLLSETANFAAKIGSKENEAKNMFNILKNLGYSDYENALLGPIIREYLLKNNLRESVKEYQDICKHFKKTPLQFELLSLLVRVSNGKDESQYQLSSTEAKLLLQDIIKVTLSIHGNNANSTFLLAVAESGTDEQIRKLLINPEFKFSQNALLKNCEHLSVSGKTEIILKLAKASRGLPNLNEQLLYNILLDNFRKENNYTAALELFEKLESEDDLKITQDFLKGLINLLKINNIQVPTSLALRLRN